MHLLRQSTASTVTVGPVLDSAGAAVTTAVVGDFKISKNGTSSTLSGATVTHDANGYYNIALTTGNTDTAGRFVIYSGNTSHSMGAHRFTVLLPSVFDALITNATNATGGLPTATAAISAFAGAISTFNRSTETVTVGTNNDKTGYSLASNGLASVTTWTVNITGNLSGSVGSVTGNVGGNVTGSVGSISGVTFPASFGSWTAPLTTSGTASAVWDALIASYTVSGSFGSRVMRTDHASAGNAAKVTGAGHVASDIHELQPAVIDSTAIAANAIGASQLAADAVTEIVTGMATQPQLVDLATMIVNDGTANARFSTSALQNAPTGGGGGTGSGARTVTITVTLSAAPVEGASVRLTKAAETYVGTTNASGVVTFNVDDGTWTVSITSPNATFAGASLVVDDAETVSYSLTAVSITPSPAGQMTGYWTCYSHLGVVESGVSVTMQLVDVPKGSKGLALDSKTRTVTANGSGVAQFTNLFPGCRYKVYRGAADNKAFYVTLPEVAPADPVELGSFYGDDE